MINYPIEQKPASQIDSLGQKRWFTPAESNAYYSTNYARDGITIHWWGDGTGADNHDNIVNFFLKRTDQGSVNYVLSDNKITQMVDPNNVAFTSQSGNPTTISIEHQPTLGDEGYKRSGWLVYELEKKYGKTLLLYPHNHWFPTACPGTIDIARIRAEADKLHKGGDMSKIETNEARILAFSVLGRDGHDNRPNALDGSQDAELSQHIGGESNAKIWEFYTSPEGENYRNETIPAVFTERNDLRTQNTVLTTTVSTQEKQINELNAQLALVGEDTANLNKLGEMLRWFVVRVGLKK